MDNKIFTVIVCAYNAENRIIRAIESIVKQQKYDELVSKFLLIDNNSTDKTAEIMKNYESKINNIQYIFESEQGLSYARLSGVNNTNSEWIIFVDDDNILEENWIIEAYEYIKGNDGLGAFNGSVVPLIEFDITEDEKGRLEVVYPGLACTNLNKEEINFNSKYHPYKIPFGAGLVIRTKPLKKLSQKGWLKSKGRTGSNLISGEDTEMCLFVSKECYNFGFNPKMIIEHIIPKTRLCEKYLINLYKGFSEYQYQLVSNKNLYIIRRIKVLLASLVKLFFKLILAKLQKSYKRNVQLKLAIASYKVFIKNIYRDKLILK